MPRGISIRKKKETASTRSSTDEESLSSSDTTCYNNSKTKSTMSPTVFASNMWNHWKSRQDFVQAQIQVGGILLVALIGNNWPYSYPRNDNENPTMFWLANLALLVAAGVTLKHDPNSSSRGLQLLSRNQTEEWKGWMQWAFIMYHYYRARFVYNEIRVFVSAYVFLTGWGNYQYFTKKQDFSVERAISMWLRINYFPLLLCLVVGTKLDDFYIVPLHTTGFFITMTTCYVAKLLEPHIKSPPKRNLAAIGLSLLVHVLFYETPAVKFLQLFSHEVSFRFKADRYSCWVGILTGFLWSYFKKWAQYFYTDYPPTLHQRCMSAALVGAGVVCLTIWYGLFGHIRDKHVYNPVHPYIFWIPIAGWLLMRNASRYLMEIHCTALEFFGRITLETYVLQFHLFMCRHVQHIPIVVPGSGGVDGNIVLKTLNMLLTGVLFVATAYYARQATVTTQTTVTELMGNAREYWKTGEWPADNDSDDDEEKSQVVVPLVQRDASSTASSTHGDSNDTVQARKGVQSEVV